MPTTQLTERVADWNRQLQVQNEERLVRNIALTGTSSRNGYQYEQQALFEAVPLYNGKPVFLDHAASGQRPPSRSTRDLVGSVINPRLEEGRIRGDIRVVDTESGRTFMALVEAQTPGVGMSHVVLAERSTDGKRVMHIQDVLSVDVVVNPATTSTFQESTCTTDYPVRESEFVAEDQVHELERLQAEITSLHRERDQLRHELEQFRSDQRTREIDQLLEAAQLPSIAIDAQLRERLANATSPDQRRQLIHERQQLVRRLTAISPVSASRTSAPSSDLAAFVSAIKHRS